MSSKSIVREFARIRLKELNGRGISLNKLGALRFLESRYATQIADASWVEIYRDVRGVAQAGVCFYKSPTFFSARKYPGILIVCDPSDSLARAWVLATL